MGYDIFSWVEVLDEESGYWKAARSIFRGNKFEKDLYTEGFVSQPFQRRTYALFGFLANVANYSHCETLAEPRGFPAGCDLIGGSQAIDESEPPGCHFERPEELLTDDFFSHSFFTLSELLAFDYDKVFWNRRFTRNRDGAALAEPREGTHESYREFLGEDYFEVLDVMKTLGPPDRVRVVFCFNH